MSLSTATHFQTNNTLTNPLFSIGGGQKENNPVIVLYLLSLDVVGYALFGYFSHSFYGISVFIKVYLPSPSQYKIQNTFV